MSEWVLEDNIGKCHSYSWERTKWENSLGRWPFNMSSKLPIVFIFFLLILFGLSICAQCNLFAVATQQSPFPFYPAAAATNSKPNIYYKYLPRDDPNKSHSRVCRNGVLVCVLSQVHFSFYWCGMLATHFPHSAATSRANKCACIAKAFCTQNQPQMHHVARDFNLCSTFACCQRN